MPPSNSYSTTAVDGSADGFGPSPTFNIRRTPSEVAAKEALARDCVQGFVNSPINSVVNITLESNSTAASRFAAAQATIDAVDAAFKNDDGVSKYQINVE